MPVSRPRSSSHEEWNGLKAIQVGRLGNAIDLRQSAAAINVRLHVGRAAISEHTIPMALKVTHHGLLADIAEIEFLAVQPATESPQRRADAHKWTHVNIPASEAELHTHLYVCQGDHRARDELHSKS
jgi:hypothetical protein